MLKTLVSIIVPVYKVEKYLPECLDSLISQTYENLEIILIDDGSPDNSGAICDEYANKDRRIKVIHKKNGGLSSARNTGLGYATGEFITFCDSDDILLPQTISRYIELFEKYNYDVISCESHFYNNGITSKIKHYHKEKPITIISGLDYIKGFFNYTTDCSVCNKFINRRIISNHKFEEGKTNEDILFLYDIFCNCDSILHTNEGLYLYRINEESITHTFNKNSLNVYYNAVILHKKVKIDLPLLEQDAFNYKISIGYQICMQIVDKKKTKEDDFKKIFAEVRKMFLFSYPRIVKSPNYSIAKKVKYLYLAIGAPFSNILRKWAVRGASRKL